METATNPIIWIGPNGECTCTTHARKFSQQLANAIAAADITVTDRGTWVSMLGENAEAEGLSCEFC